MASNSIEKARGEVLRIIEIYFLNPAVAINVLAERYAAPEDAEGAAFFKPAMRSLIFDSTKKKAQRCVIISAIGRAGEMADAYEFLMLLLENGLVRNRAAYQAGEREVYGDLVYQADPDETVRVRALLAIEDLMGKHTNGKLKPASAQMGRTLVKCALLDSSERARISAARLLGNFGDGDTLNLMMRVMLEAESGKNNFFWRLRRGKQAERHGEVHENGMDAVSTITENMKAGGVRWSAVSSLLYLAEGSSKTWKFASGKIMEACRGSEERAEVLNLTSVKVSQWEGRKEWGVVRRAKGLCSRMRKEGFMDPPAKMRGNGPEALGAGRALRAKRAK